MKEDHGRVFRRPTRRRQKKLPMDRETVGGREDHLLGRHQILGRVRRDGFRREIAHRSAADLYRRSADFGGARTQKSNRSICNNCRFPLDPLSEQERGGLTTRSSHPPYVPAIDVVLIGRKKYFAPVTCEGSVLHFKLAGGEKLRPAAVGRDGI